MTLSSDIILESLPHPVIVVDQDNCVCAANPAAEDLLQHSAEVLNGTPLTDYVPADNPLISLIDVARNRQNSASEFDIHLESPKIGEHSVTAHVSPLLHRSEEEGAVIISLLPRG
ncbi:MAG: PAS domain-containing protein, partial [Alphaproteobacteria bacterium]